jgi:hypothetical protein
MRRRAATRRACGKKQRGAQNILSARGKKSHFIVDRMLVLRRPYAVFSS